MAIKAENASAFTTLNTSQESFEKASNITGQVLPGAEIAAAVANLLGRAEGSEERVTGVLAVQNSLLLGQNALKGAYELLETASLEIDNAAEATAATSRLSDNVRQDGVAAINTIRSYAGEHQIPLTES